MSFQIGDNVRFTYGGKTYKGKICDKKESAYYIIYKGIFPSSFRTDSSVKIVSSDLALVNGDLALQDGDIALSGEAIVQCKSEDVRSLD